MELMGDLGDVEMFMLMEVVDSVVGVIIDHNGRKRFELECA